MTNTLINLTPHAVVIVDANHATVVSLAPSGNLARCAEASTLVDTVDGVNYYATTYGPVVGLPDPVEGVRLIVSALVRAAVPHRTDVCSPGILVRDEAGRPVGCLGLVINRGA